MTPTQKGSVPITTSQKTIIKNLRHSPRLKVFRPAEITYLNDEAIWRHFLKSNPILEFVRPDFYALLRVTDNIRVLFQQNINLDFGGKEVNLDTIYQNIPAEEVCHLKKTDAVMARLTGERKLRPLDYTYRVGSQILCDNHLLKHLLRSTTLIHCDTAGNGKICLVYFQNVTGTISSFRTNNFDLTCRPELSFLFHEAKLLLQQREETLPAITRREKEIVDCLRKGMSSKEIAAKLYISITTVNTHRQNMLRKWGLPNTAAIIQKCFREDLI